MVRTSRARLRAPGLFLHPLMREVVTYLGSDRLRRRDIDFARGPVAFFYLRKPASVQRTRQVRRLAQGRAEIIDRSVELACLQIDQATRVVWTSIVGL
jgi:hypothetical protein